MERKHYWSRYHLAPWPARFWAKVEKSEGCWIWTACVDTAGYPTIRIAGKLRRASQVAWELDHGTPFPADRVCCHKCDNRLCVNPDHLFAGSRQDNADDMCAKGRQATGERSSQWLYGNGFRGGEAHFKARLTEEQVHEVRLAADNGARRKDLKAMAARFDCSLETLYSIIYRRSWKHLE